MEMSVSRIGSLTTLLGLGEGALRVLVLGSCRVHDPLIAAHRLGQVEYLNRRLKSRAPMYLQDINEMIQFVRLASAEIPLPPEIAPFAFRSWRFDRQMPVVLRAAQRIVIEVCTDKYYHAMGYALSTNEIHRQLVAPAGAAGALWWTEVNSNNGPRHDAIAGVETALRQSGVLTDAHRLMLREIALTRLSSEAIADGMVRLLALTVAPVLVMPHVAVRLADGTFLAERTDHIEKTLAAARRLGLLVLDPHSFVERDGQQRALDKGGTDVHHYAKDYLPIAGHEIARSLRDCTRTSWLTDEA